MGSKYERGRLKRLKHMANMKARSLERLCPTCKTFFKTKRSTKRFCSTKCQFAEWSRTHPRKELYTDEEYVELQNLITTGQATKKFYQRVQTRKYPACLKEFLESLLDSGYIYGYTIKIKAGKRWLYKVDLANPHTKHVVELDWPDQRNKNSVLRDQQKDADLTRAGWTVSRL